MSDSSGKKAVKVRLVSQGEDSESPWAEDLGPAPGVLGARRVRLSNVPFLHAKPTYGDVIVVTPDEDGILTWDRQGVEWNAIGTRIEEDGGRWIMILDYLPTGNTPVETAFSALCTAAETLHIIAEGCHGPRSGRPGSVYLAVPADLDASTVLRHLSAAQLPLLLTLIHPV